MHPALQYIQDIESGKLPACQLIKQAIERHKNDLETGQERGLYFNPKPANLFINWCANVLKFTKGSQYGKPVVLEPWQIFHYYLLFGWRVGSATGPRRFRISYLEIPRKNGKTTMAAAVAIYMAFFDNEARGQVYTAATKRDQAKLCLNDCKEFIKASPVLSSKLEQHTNSIFLKHKTGSVIDSNFVQSLSADSNTLDGLDIHCAVVDELHAHKDAALTDVIKTATGARQQPLIYNITTAGSDKTGVCFDYHTYTRKILAGQNTDDRFLGMIYNLDESDIYTDQTTWIKANPNLGVSKHLEYIQGEVNEAKNRLSYENTVKRYDFNLWTDALSSWVKTDSWQRQAIDTPDLTNYTAYAGLDLAATEDFNACTLFFVSEDESKFFVMPFFWIPEEKFKQRNERLPHLFRSWQKSGFVNVTPGNVMDDKIITEDLLNLFTKYNVSKLSYDRYLAHSGIIQNIIEQKTPEFCTAQSQNITAMSEPTKKLEKLINSDAIQHNGNPIFKWMLDNVVIYRDANDNVKIIKSKAADKVDGPVSLVMAVAEWMENRPQAFNDYYTNPVIMNL